MATSYSTPKPQQPATTELTAMETKNIAETLADVLPKVAIIGGIDQSTAAGVTLASVPKGHELREIDLERLLPAPRRAVLAISLAQPESFIDYLTRHTSPATVVWCDFNPQTHQLAFEAVFDDLGAKQLPGWRGHRARYAPEHSAEWKVWTRANGMDKAQAQLDFAMFLERNESDIAAVDGMPTSAQMMQMATAFEANSDKRVKSIVKIQGGGSRLDFIDDNNAETEANMKLFEKFAIGVPVFWAGPSYRVDARLRYRHASGKVAFWYELIRADRVHEAAAKELIEKIRTGLPEGVPLLMGTTAKT
jgi:uncharacterized protein YfdQ (DUF2303 family)